MNCRPALALENENSEFDNKPNSKKQSETN